MKKETKYKFNIWNFTKPQSLFKDGMQLMWKSKKQIKFLGGMSEEMSWKCIPEENIHGELRYFRSKI